MNVTEPAIPATRRPVRGPVPGEAWYALPPVLLIAGLCLGLWITQATMVVQDGTRLPAPGEATVEITRAGDYVLWDEYRTNWEGQRIDAPSNLRAIDAAGLEEGSLPDELREAGARPQGPMNEIFDMALVTVTEVATGQPARQKAVLHSRENMGHTVRVTLGKYQLEPGQYRVKVWGEFAPRVFQLRKSADLRYYAGFLGGLFVSLLGGVGAPALFLWIYLQRKRAAEAEFPPVSPVQPLAASRNPSPTAAP